MIELLQQAFRPSLHAVVEGRNAVEDHQRDPIDGHADDAPGIALQAGQHHQGNGPGQRQQRTDQVGPGIETFAVIHASSRSGSHRDSGSA